MSSPQPIPRPDPTEKITAEAVLTLLNKEGIQTLDQFARRYADSVRSSMRSNPGLQASFGPAFAGLPAPAPKPLIHRVPTHALTVDGVQIALNDITKYNGRPLHFFVNAEMHAEKRFAAYTSEQGLKQALQTHQQKAGAIQPLTSGGNNTGYCFENIGFGGATLKIPRMSDFWNFTLPDLTKVYRNCFLWWCWNPWNDIISSVKSEDHLLRFWENINLSGSSLLIAVGVQISSLVPLGWNDRTSSIQIADL
jgi:hypothetical protein